MMPGGWRALTILTKCFSIPEDSNMVLSSAIYMGSSSYKEFCNKIECEP